MSNNNKKSINLTSPSSIAQYLGLSSPTKKPNIQIPENSTNNSSETISTSQKANVRKQPYERTRPVTRAQTKKLKSNNPDPSDSSNEMETDLSNLTNETQEKHNNIPNTADNNPDTADNNQHSTKTVDNDQHSTEMEILHNTRTPENTTLHDFNVEQAQSIYSTHNSTIPEILIPIINNKGKNPETSDDSNWTLVKSTKRYKGWLSVSSLPQETIKDKIIFTKETFIPIPGFIRAKTEYIDNTCFICTEFSSQEALEKAAEISINEHYLTLEKPFSSIQANPLTIIALKDISIGTDKKQIHATHQHQTTNR